MGNRINAYIWSGLGLAMGYAWGWLVPAPGRQEMVENMLVGVFGAFIGGDFLVSQLNGGIINDTDFSFRSLAFAVGGTVAALLLLGWMRRAVGPLRSNRSKARDRR